MAVVELEICKKAARWLNKTFTRNENEDDWPEGCYLSGKVYFNRHSTGSRNYDGRQICHAKGMLYTFCITSIHQLLKLGAHKYILVSLLL